MADHIIEVSELTYKYNDDYKALDKVSIQIKKGVWTSIVGENGSGKSTLVRCIDGLIFYKEGSIKVDGVELKQDTLLEIRKKIGIIFQNPDNQFVGATVADDVAFGLENLNMDYQQMHQIVDDVLKKVGMLEYKQFQPDKLSGGQKQRVALAGILAVKPEIIILDESTSMLDPKGRNEMLSLIDNLVKLEDITVISITHDVEEIVLSDDVIVLDSGKIIGKWEVDKFFTNDQLIKNLGLSQPFMIKLEQLLKEQGLPLGKVDFMNEDKLIEEQICPLILNR